LRSHINEDPGTHNFEVDNRQALYRILGDFFYAGAKDYDPKEIDSKKEVKGANDLAVDLPEKNVDFNKLALSLAESLPRDGTLPEKDAALWQVKRREQLKQSVAAKAFK